MKRRSGNAIPDAEGPDFAEHRRIGRTDAILSGHRPPCDGGAYRQKAVAEDIDDSARVARRSRWIALRAANSPESIERAGSTPRSLIVPIAVSGRHARAALADASTWRILAIFRRSVYCQAAHGAVVCIGPLSLGTGPLNILAALPSEWSWQGFGVARDTPVHWDDGILRFDRRLAFSFGQAHLWSPEVSVLDWEPVVLSAALDRLTAECRRRAPVEGLAPLILQLLRGGSPEIAVSGFDRVLMQAATSGVASLKAWLESVVGGENTLNSPPQTLEKLIGLGPGLTPSGDDLLGGVLIALRALGWPDAADSMGRWLLRRARTRTHAISYAHLRCAADGAGAAAFHDTLTALVSPGASGLGGHLDAIAAIGHSSGWDTLAGMALVASLAATLPPHWRPPDCLVPVRCNR